MELSVIIVNYNTIELLQKCICSIKENSGDVNLEIIVVDNASVDKSREIIPTLDVKYILCDENLGFSKANNLGLKQATGKYVLFLNPDTLVLKGTLRRCVDFL